MTLCWWQMWDKRQSDVKAVAPSHRRLWFVLVEEGSKQTLPQILIKETICVRGKKSVSCHCMQQDVRFRNEWLEAAGCWYDQQHHCSSWTEYTAAGFHTEILYTCSLYSFDEEYKRHYSTIYVCTNSSLSNTTAMVKLNTDTYYWCTFTDYRSSYIISYIPVFGCDMSCL